MITAAINEDRVVDKQLFAWLIFSLALAIAPLVTHLPVWISACCVAIGGWRLMAAHHRWPLPGRVLLVFMTLLSILAIFFNFGTLFGQRAGIALLIIMLALKILEINKVRDAVIVIFFAYFASVASALYTQSLPITVYLLAVFIIITTVLIRLNQQSNKMNMTDSLRIAGRLFSQALPLMIILYFLFPRIPGPLIGLPKDAFGGMTGLDEKMTPGSISHLGQSNRIAFRAKFDDAIPENKKLYWRGPVLWHTDGKTWTAGNISYSTKSRQSASKLEKYGSPNSYTVTLEPHNRRWLYALDMPGILPDDSYITPDYRVLTDAPIRKLARYPLTSYLDYHTGSISQLERVHALQLPETANPHTRALGEFWRDTLRNDRKIIARALEYFNKQAFVYTLNPPLLDQDPVDQFMFETRRGFCGHYSSAFTVLMRAAGIPARVVTGYQGGEYNPVGDYLIVKQKDAHAWVEVWLEDSGWTRFDPTAAVAPERVELGIDSVLDPASESSGLSSLRRSDYWLQLRYNLDALNNVWNQWMLGYNATRQLSFLSSLGMHSWVRMVFGIIIGCAFFITVIIIYLLIKQRPKDEPVVAEYRRYCEKLLRCGIERTPAEGPADFANRVTSLRPELASQVDMINKLYIALRYGRSPSSQYLRRLHQQVSAFKP